MIIILSFVVIIETNQFWIEYFSKKKIFIYFDRNDPDALVEIEPEMDLEIQLAFKDFVSYQNKKWSNSVM